MTVQLQELLLEVVGLCNAACSYCEWQMKPKESKVYMTPDFACRILSEAGNMNVKLLRYHSVGESLLHPKLISIMRHGHTCGIEAESLSTNCFLLKDRLAEELADMDWLELILAIPWVEPRSSFVEQCIANAKAYLESSPRNRIIRLQMVTEAGAEKYLPRLLEMLPLVESLPAAMIQLKSPVTWPHSPPQAGFRVDIPYNPKIFVDPIRAPFSLGHGCRQPTYLLSVRADGIPSPCCIAVDSSWKLPSLKVMSLKDIWEGQQMVKIRDQWANKSNDILCGPCQTRTDC